MNKVKQVLKDMNGWFGQNQAARLVLMSVFAPIIFCALLALVVLFCAVMPLFAFEEWIERRAGRKRALNLKREMDKRPTSYATIDFGVVHPSYLDEFSKHFSEVRQYDGILEVKR